MKILKSDWFPVVAAFAVGGLGVWEAAAMGGGGDDVKQIEVRLSGGHETDPRDGGRPVALVAAALEVPPEVFRKAFKGVTPAAGGKRPTGDQVRRNKDALLRVLAPYGVTNDRLDEVSDYYRYSPGRGEMWRNRPARVVANVKDGRVISFTVEDAGAGYTSPPTVEIPGFLDVRARAELKFGRDLKTNGSIAAVEPEAKN